MENDLDWLIQGVAVGALLGIPLYAWRVRGRTYAIFAFVILLLSLPGAVAMHARLGATFPQSLRMPLDLAFVAGLLAAATHMGSLVTPRLRTWAFRWGVSIPGQAFVAAGALSGLWLLALWPLRAALGGLELHAAVLALRWLDVAPFALAAVSLVTSSRLVDEVVRFPLRDPAGADSSAGVQRLPVERYRRRLPAPLAARPLRLVQISDPHLGPWQPIKLLARRIDELIDREPDLVLLTGDFLTMEGSGTPGALASALAPLRRLPGRCFAIFGNHDHEAPDEVRAALSANGVRLLLDEEALVATEAGPVQLIGADYVGRGREAHIQQLLARFPARSDHLRVFLLHDPLGFRHVPVGDVDLTLSGHTHGGQIGLVSFGLDWTVLSRSQWPDHGLFGHGSNRLYVHRGTGFYGFPLRIGVPGEASMLELVTRG